MPKWKSAILAVAAIALAAGLYWWWEHERIYPSTDDAYLQANIVTVGAQILGTVAQVRVSENEKVERGAPLFNLDQAVFEAAVRAAEAQLDIAIQSVGSSSANVDAAKANLAQANATLADAQAEFERIERLFKAGDIAKTSLDQARAARDTALGRRDAARASIQAAVSELGATGENNANVRAARAYLDQARINFALTEVVSPVAGWIANISLRPGQVVSPGQSLFSIVDDSEWWVTANFKETDLDRIRPGQPASIGIDMYPGIKLKGKVESIGAGSGAVFSLVPPENATGNWVKVTQRFPVRIRLSEELPHEALQLRVGASTTVTVDTSGFESTAAGKP